LSPEPQLPWPLRGVLRVSENDLLRVGETRLAVSEALGALDFVWDDRGLMVRLVDSCLVQQALDAAPVALEPEQLQQAADAYRRGKGLLGAEQTTRWLADRGLTTERFATLVESAAAVAQLRKQVVADRADEWIAEHAEELETIVVAWFAVTPEIARELDSGSASAAFGKDPCGAVGFAIRTGRPAGILRALAMNAPPDLRHADVGSALITAIEGELAVAMVLDRAQAVDDVHTRRIAERAMFDQWLAEQRDGADIEWYWGDATRTAAAR
jgi:putative peptide maturation system protein